MIGAPEGEALIASAFGMRVIGGDLVEGDGFERGDFDGGTRTAGAIGDDDLQADVAALAMGAGPAGGGFGARFDQCEQRVGHFGGITKGDAGAVVGGRDISH